MKTFAWHVLILGGFYFVISLLFLLPQNIVIDIADVVISTVFFIMLIVLCFKRKYNFINIFQNKFPRTTNYIAALGFVEYFSVLFITIPGIIYGYQASKAQYNGSEISPAPAEYHLNFIYYTYIAVLCLSIIWATYKSFIKK